METFLGKIAKFIKESDTQLENWTIILPSQRAVNYLQKEIYTAYERPVFSPKTFTINQWVKELTPQTILDKTRLLLALFEIHKKNGTESIDQKESKFGVSVKIKYSLRGRQDLWSFGIVFQIITCNLTNISLVKT